ncbi:hypothetical protein LguiB_013190 [Lonicera macranthoides]
MVIINETIHNNKYSVKIDFGGVHWLIKGLNKASQSFGENQLFSEYHTSYALFLLQRYSDKNGCFMSLSKLQQGTVKCVVVFPAGKKGDGWSEVAGELDRLLFALPKYRTYSGMTDHKSKRGKQYTRRPLNWDKRIKIAMGAAQGLEYLHTNNIILRDMRPNNILVTHDHESLLGDFGPARAQYDDVEHSSETSEVGTLGYVAPEYAECGKLSTKTDVYSFGVVLLQLITGLKTTDKKLGGKSLVGWARPLLKEKNYGDLIDQRIEEAHDVHQLFWMVRVAEKCLCKDPTKRYSMERVTACRLAELGSRLDWNGSSSDEYSLVWRNGSSKGASHTGSWGSLETHIRNTTSIRDFSPAQSDSANSRAGSFELQDDAAANAQLSGTSFYQSSITDVSSRRSSASTSPLLASATRRTRERKRETSYNEMVI